MKADTRKFWLATALITAGVVLLFCGLFISPQGVISSSVIGGAGEIFITAGAILGIDVVYSKRLTDIVKDITKNDNNEQTH